MKITFLKLLKQNVSYAIHVTEIFDCNRPYHTSISTIKSATSTTGYSNIKIALWNFFLL